MKSISEMRSLNPVEKLHHIQRTFGSDKNIEYTPYCMCCRSGLKMQSKDYGFQCSSCGNMLGFDGMRLIESPLNNEAYLQSMKNQGIVYSNIVALENR